MNYFLGKLLFWANKIFKRNSYLHSKIIQKYENSELWGLGIFILRGASLDVGLLEPSKSFIRKHNFDIIDTKILSDLEITRISEKARGADWVDGSPVALIVVFDNKPVRVSGKYVKKYPDMDNGNLLIKLEMRAHLNSKVHPDYKSNFVHVTDNSFKALKYLSLISDNYKDRIITKVNNKFK